MDNFLIYYLIVNYMERLLSFFSGKKTYIVGALMILLGLMQDDKNTILEGIVFITLRAGIAKK